MSWQDFLENAASILGILLAFCALVGIVWKVVVLPQLLARFAPLKAQLEETHHQVTTNGHANPEAPTLKDELHNLRSEVRELKGETRSDLAGLRTDMRVMGKVYDRHVDWSATEAGKLWNAITHFHPEARHRYDGNSAADERNK